jgi:hypothetical protein
LGLPALLPFLKEHVCCNLVLKVIDLLVLMDIANYWLVENGFSVDLKSFDSFFIEFDLY